MVVRIVCTILAVAGVGLAAASAHEIPWHAGMSRQVGYGTCAKGSCQKRASFASSVPHRHLGAGKCQGQGAGGYAKSRNFPCPGG